MGKRVFTYLKGMIVMGGRFYEHELFDLGKWGVVEWNIKCDPFAVKIVFNSDVKDFYIAGIEQTCKFRKDAPEVAEKIQHLSWMKPVSDAIRDKDDTWFHDAVAIWAMLYPKNVAWKKGDISVDLDDIHMGKTSFSENKNGKHMVLADIDVGNFFDSYAAQMGFEWN